MFSNICKACLVLKKWDNQGDLWVLITYVKVAKW